MSRMGMSDMHTSLTLDSKQFINGLASAQAQATRFGRGMQASFMPMQRAERSMMVFGGRALGLGRLTGFGLAFGAVKGIKDFSKTLTDVSETYEKLGRDAAIRKSYDLGIAPTESQLQRMIKAGDTLRSWVSPLSKIKEVSFDLFTKAIDGVPKLMALSKQAAGLSGFNIADTFLLDPEAEVRGRLSNINKELEPLRQRMDAYLSVLPSDLESMKGPEWTKGADQYRADYERFNILEEQRKQAEKELDALQTKTTKAKEAVLTRPQELEKLRGDFGFRRVSELDAFGGRNSPEMKPLGDIHGELKSIKQLAERWWSWYQRKSSVDSGGVRLV